MGRHRAGKPQPLAAPPEGAAGTVLTCPLDGGELRGRVVQVVYTEPPVWTESGRVQMGTAVRSDLIRMALQCLEGHTYPCPEVDEWS